MSLCFWYHNGSCRHEHCDGHTGSYYEIKFSVVSILCSLQFIVLCIILTESYGPFMRYFRLIWEINIYLIIPKSNHIKKGYAIPYHLTSSSKY
jgi:hypothetical protein